MASPISRKVSASKITRKHTRPVDAPLDCSIRNFSRGSEPSGTGAPSNSCGLRKPATARGLPFVIQKHEASHLHYDFRLSWGGVLKSWVIAKGPSYNPAERRLAIEVEDHPLEYVGFEGTIPKGQYGGGTVMIWDQGSWWPQLGSENVDACLRAGHLQFEMSGSRMKGKWALIRMNKDHAKGASDDKPHWLLIKQHDQYETGPGDPSVTDEIPNSSVTGFTQQLRHDLPIQLDKLRVSDSPFDSAPREATHDAFMVRPELVNQARFATWTADNLVRQADFLDLGGDKFLTEVTRKSPTVAPQPKHSQAAEFPDTAHASHNPLRSTALRHFALPSHPLTRSSTAAPDLRLTHPNKVLDSSSGLTKQQLATYYTLVADRMLPYIANRPLSLLRCPEGASRPCFFQKHVGPSLPPGIKTVDIADKTSSSPEPYITLYTPEAIVALAHLDALEIHPWSSTNNDLEHPDRLVFDLDPDPDLPWLTLSAAAAEVRQLLKNVGLESFLKLTGGKGLHIVAPIMPTVSWVEIKAAAHIFALSLERNNPYVYVTKMSKSSRVGKIFIDYLRNQRGATSVAPYSPRARHGAPISLPLPWSALNRAVHPNVSVNDVVNGTARLSTDPWKDFLTLHQQLHPKLFAIL